MASRNKPKSGSEKTIRFYDTAPSDDEFALLGDTIL